ncbi:MAG: glycosyltransferase [Candidatus Paceibacterota bacterium]
MMKPEESSHTERKIRSQRVLLIAHKFLPQPDDDLVLYLNNNKVEDVMHITHAFSDSPNRKSKCKWYKKGILYKDWGSRDYKKLPEVFIYLKEFLFTISCAMKAKLVWDRSICVDGLCTFFGLSLRVFGKTKKVIYWAIDFVPENRFKSNLKNHFYNFFNKFGCKNADEMWDLSPRMAEAREKFLGVKESSYKKHKIVSYGVWLDRIKKYCFEECDKNSLVFMGHLLEKQGVQLVIRAIPEIIKKIPDFRFKVIGTGKYETELKQISKDLEVDNYVLFLGKIEKTEDLENEIARSCVAIAPYISKLDAWTKYADPGKIKTYLACGVPVLLTDVSWNAREIEKKNCGKILLENVGSITDGVVEMVGENVNRVFRDNAKEYAKVFDYGKIFGQLDL